MNRLSSKHFSILVLIFLSIYISACTIRADIRSLDSLSNSSKNDPAGTDSVPPTLVITTPSTVIQIDSSNAFDFEIVASCTEDNKETALEIMSGSFKTTYSGICIAGTTTFEVDLSSVPDGELNIIIKQSDSAGNIGQSSSLVLTKKANAPTVLFTTSPTSNVITSTFQVTMTFSEIVTGVDASQLAPSNGIIQNFSGSGTTYIFDFVPAAEGTTSVTLLSGVIKDNFNNLLPAGNVLTKYYDKDIVRAEFLVRENLFTEGNQVVTTDISLTGSKPYDMSVSVDIQGNAKAGIDYTISPFDVTIPANTTTVSISVNLYGNSVMDEGDRTLTLSISDTSTPMLRVKEQSYTNIIILEDDKSTSFGSVADMTVGYHHSCLRYQSGIVKCWGDNSYGQLGIGSTTSTSTPTIVDASLNYKMISAAGRATCGIMNSTNQVKCWGYNGYGEVGDGTYTQRNSPVLIDAATTYKKVVIGGSSNGGPTTCGITSSDDLKCWGDNNYGQYGNGSYSSSLTPVTVHAGTKYKDISIGGLFACAITLGNELKCWGVNWDGQLGDGTYNDSDVPISLDTGTSYATVSSGGYHACGITVSGVLKCWGWGKGTGTNTLSDQMSPVEVDAGTSYSFISAGEEGACAITTAGVLKCWGSNEYGQIGNSSVAVGSTSNQLTPIVVDAGVSYLKVAMQRAWAGGSSSVHVCAITTSGDLKCWGGNTYEQLGLITYTKSPIDIGSDTYSDLIYSSGKLIGLTSGGKFKAIGSNSSYELGDSSGRYFTYPFNMFLNPILTQISGSGTFCGISATDDLYCWGNNTYGSVGDGTTVNKANPVLIDAGTKYSKVSAEYVTCAITTAGVLKCWGYNPNGAVGDGTTVNKLSPVVIDSGTTYSQVKTTSSNVCAITTAGNIKCWGQNLYGAVGDGTTVNKTTPTLIDSSTTYSKIEGSGSTNCGITTTGVLKCWGYNLFGPVGDGTTANKTSPTIINSGTAYSIVKTNSLTTCGITTTGVLKCWGRNTNGAIGDGSTTNRLSPVVVNSGVNYMYIHPAGIQGTCGITTAGVLKCWGSNTSGYIGDGTTVNRLTPTVIDSGVNYVKAYYSTSSPGSCGLTTTGKIKCWGTVNYLQGAPTNVPGFVLNIR